MMANSSTSTPEYTTFRKCYQTIILYAKEQTGAFCNALFANGYVPPSVRDQTRNKYISDEEKAQKLADTLIDRIEQDPSVYHGFMKIIEEAGPWADDFVKTLKDSYEAEVKCKRLADTSGNSSSSDESFHSATADLEQSSLETKFPYLDLSIDDSQRADLEAKLRFDIRSIKKRFSDFRVAIRDSLEARVTLDKIKDSILSLDAFSDGIGVKVLDPHDSEKIESADSLSKVFMALRSYVSFFNYEIIERLVHQYGSTQDKRQLEEYNKVLTTFCQRNVYEIPPGAYSSTRLEAKKLVLKCTNDTLTLQDVRIIKEKVAEILGLNYSTLQLCSIKDGCIELHFLISAAVADHIFPVSPSQHSALSEIGVKVRGHQDETQAVLTTPQDVERKCLKDEVFQPVSMVAEQDKKVIYPKQTILFKLDNEFLTPDSDGFYFQHRNYYLNDVDALGSGGFGTCMFGKDHVTEQSFAMKRNKESGECIIESMNTECLMLSKLKPHAHVVRFLGAVIDEDEDNVLLPRAYKIFLELADCGTLAEMLVLEDGTKEALPLDQSLYYIEQVLQAVHFLYQNSVLHLNIKALDVLVFDGGRTVKLADFGTAIQVSEIAAEGGKITGCTPYFAAPEVVRQELPGFSADIWGVMCVLVELLTTHWPGCHTVTRSQQQMIFLVAQYQDSDIDEIIPLSKYSEIDSEIAQLFQAVFVANPTKRPSALTLLNHPRIREAPEYAAVFDGYEACDDEIDKDIPTETSEVVQHGLSLGSARSSSSSQATTSDKGTENASTHNNLLNRSHTP